MKIMIAENGSDAALALDEDFVEGAWEVTGAEIEHTMRKQGAHLDAVQWQRMRVLNAVARAVSIELAYATGSPPSQHWNDVAFSTWEAFCIRGETDHPVEAALAVASYWREAA